MAIDFYIAIQDTIFVSRQSCQLKENHMNNIQELALAKSEKIRLEEERLREEAATDAIDFAPLLAAGFTDIARVGDTITASLLMADLAQVGILTQLGYTMVSTVLLLDSTFKIGFQDTIQEGQL